jgi:hypothetical protein
MMPEPTIAARSVAVPTPQRLVITGRAGHAHGPQLHASDTHLWAFEWDAGKRPACGAMWCIHHANQTANSEFLIDRYGGKPVAASSGTHSEG